MGKRAIYITTSSVIFLFLVAFWINFDPPEESDLIVSVKKGPFEIAVVTTGELEAKNSVKINAPDALRSAGVLFKIKIADLVPEGTEVKKGDYVASLDKADVLEKMRTVEVEIQKLQNLLRQGVLDTSISLRQEREELANRYYALKEKQNYLKGLKYEAPAEIKQAELALEKATRNYQQAKGNYQLKRQQSATKIYEVASLLEEENRKQQAVKVLIENFTIKAPEDGMVIYTRDWQGERRTIGSQIDAFDPVVATLPDLSTMISRTFVNEIDISRIKVGQKVVVGVDAFPDKKIMGKVIRIANVGELQEGSSVKVFEVLVELTEKDKGIRPTMTTSNKIICYETKQVTYLPLECLHTNKAGESYVFVKNSGRVIKKQVEVGQTNDTQVIILKGLEAEDKVYLSKPANADSKELVRLKKKGKMG
ncbi:MAG: efflux RND transporter periplasmic adaptor subunit [Thermonemataceae bacterium]